MRALRITVSGSYKTTQGDTIDFEDVTGVIPFVDQEHAEMHTQARYTARWIKAAVTETDKKIYPERIDTTRQIFIDEMEETSHDFSYVGKDIKLMTYDELQDLATAKDLRHIPLPQSQSGLALREARVRAYIAYAEKVNNNFIDENAENFNFSELPSLVADGDVRLDRTEKITNEDIIEKEQSTKSTGAPKDSYTLDQLKDIADKKGVKFHWNVGHDKLYRQLFS